MAQIYSGFYIRSHSRSFTEALCTTSCIMWSHDTTVTGFGGSNIAKFIDIQTIISTVISKFKKHGNLMLPIFYPR